MGYYTVARMRNYPLTDGSKTTQRIVITQPNLTPLQVAKELKKKSRFANVAAEQMVKDIEIIGDEDALPPTDIARVASMLEKNVHITK